MPQDIITGFKNGHQAIMSAVSQVRQVVRSYPAARSRLHELNDILMAHLSRQDREFFKRLFDYYEGNRESTKMLEFLSLDVKDLKINYLTFLDKHLGDAGSRRVASFPKDFTDFTQTLMMRIQLEEEYLIPLLERAKGKADP